ncbi:SIS domain-containing protein, partial [Clostridioides difficile]|uniref:SIS domain-containing protein n=1 Tax=Clostridioides difficile TaxID=1496 RepID=UPI001F270E7D
NLINVENIDMCLNEIHNSKHIYFFGVGSSRLVCTEMSQRFSAIGVNVKYYDDSTLMYLAASNITKDDLVIAVSMSGETAQVIKACNIAKTNQVKVISLTNISVNSLSNIADIKLFVSSPQYNFNSVNYTSRVPAPKKYICLELCISFKHISIFSTFIKFCVSITSVKISL